MKIFKIAVTTSLALCLVTPTFGAEVWECSPGLFGGESVFAVAGENSNIYMAGQTIDTQYKVEAINRVWNWGLGEYHRNRPDIYRYEFRIENGIDGFFYDIKKSTAGWSLQATYSCHKERK